MSLDVVNFPISEFLGYAWRVEMSIALLRDGE